MNQSRSSGGYIFTVNMKSMQFILPISMLSFLFSQSPAFDGLLNLLQIYGFDSTSTLFIRAGRAYAFLLFTGLFALLINNSGASKMVPESIISTFKTAIKTTVRKGDLEEEDDEIVPDRVTDQVLAADHDDVRCDEDDHNDADLGADHEDERCDDNDDDDVLAGDREDERCDDDIYDDEILDHDEEDQEDDIYDHDDNDCLSDESDAEETEEVIVWGISVEELNCKCDDFIKNMRHLL